MEIEYKYKEEDQNFYKLKNGNIYERVCYNIQVIWSKIHACHKELITLYCAQAKLNKKEDSNWGICINDMSYLPEKLFDCSVGMVRKMRNSVKDPDGTCKTCPYFIQEEKIKNLYRKGE